MGPNIAYASSDLNQDRAVQCTKSSFLLDILVTGFRVTIHMALTLDTLKLVVLKSYDYILLFSHSFKWRSDLVVCIVIGLLWHTRGGRKWGPRSSVYTVLPFYVTKHILKACILLNIISKNTHSRVGFFYIKIYGFFEPFFV